MEGMRHEDDSADVSNYITDFADDLKTRTYDRSTDLQANIFDLDTIMSDHVDSLETQRAGEVGAHKDAAKKALDSYLETRYGDDVPAFASSYVLACKKQIDDYEYNSSITVTKNNDVIDSIVSECKNLIETEQAYRDYKDAWFQNLRENGDSDAVKAIIDDAIDKAPSYDSTQTLDDNKTAFAAYLAPYITKLNEQRAKEGELYKEDAKKALNSYLKTVYGNVVPGFAVMYVATFRVDIEGVIASDFLTIAEFKEYIDDLLSKSINLIENEQAYRDYEDASFRDLREDGDSDAVKAIINEAIANVPSYLYSNTLDDSKTALATYLAPYITRLTGQRAKEVNENKAAVETAIAAVIREDDSDAVKAIVPGTVNGYDSGKTAAEQIAAQNKVLQDYKDAVEAQRANEKNLYVEDAKKALNSYLKTTYGDAVPGFAAKYVTTFR
ncbi:MAG: hypothetical protein CW338_02090, partial [Clostridiales bacterium]|nr:hypothetical protein [Clostridiales bacterium]